MIEEEADITGDEIDEIDTRVNTEYALVQAVALSEMPQGCLRTQNISTKSSGYFPQCGRASAAGTMLAVCQFLHFERSSLAARASLRVRSCVDFLATSIPRFSQIKTTSCSSSTVLSPLATLHAAHTLGEFATQQTCSFFCNELTDSVNSVLRNTASPSQSTARVGPGVNV